MVDEVKKRRILDRDLDSVEKYIKDELESRQRSTFRKSHERKWKEVDRQVEMEPMKRVSPDGREIKGDWASVLELGELSKASEIIAADVMRIAFAKDTWFEAHVDLSEDSQIDPATGKMVVEDAGAQEMADGILRALMVQQHKDFGLKARVKLSIKEALHHGSFVAEIRWDEQMMAQGANIKTVGAPAWQPYSMWNAYPDPSPSVVGTNLFYTGSMILIEYMPLHKLKRMSGEGWIPSRLKMVKKEEHKDKDNETKDVKLVKYFGDVCIERKDGDIYLPNMKVILANDTLVYAKPIDLAFPPIIFAGYERQDVRDPYYTSPIIKQSPTQKFTSVMTNEFIDAVRLRTRPPVEYDGNDPDYVANGGPNLSPGTKNPTKSMGKGMKTLEVGDPVAALKGMEFGFRQLQEGLGVSSLRQGSQSSDRQTATEAKIMEQGSEVRTIDFIGSIELQAMRPFLYMQHALNRMKLREYVFYSDELNTPDVMRITGEQIRKDAHFDVTGAKGILGERERQQQTSNVVLFASGNPMFAPLLKKERVLVDMLKDAGKRNPEEWVEMQEGPQIPPEVQAKMQEMGQLIQQLQGELQKAKMGLAADMARLELDKQKAAADMQIKQAQVMLERQKAENAKATDRAELVMAVEKATKELALERERMAGEYQLKQQEIAADFKAEVMKIEANHHAKMCEMEGKMEIMGQRAKARKAKIRKTEQGYEVEESS